MEFEMKNERTKINSLYSFAGEFDAESFKEILKSIEKDLKLKIYQINFDLTNVRKLSSYAIKILIIVHKKIFKQNGKLNIIVSSELFTLLERMGLTKVMNIQIKGD
jgi:anti-anti-sigma regulatory factor